jgi:cytochrome c553
MTEVISRLLACGAGGLAAAAAVMIVLAGGAEGAGQASAGRAKAAQCQPCHGLDGVARQPNAATIAGESEIYLAKQLKAFRAGERQDPQMSLIAGGLSDQDIADLAAWYSSIKITVEVPE